MVKELIEKKKDQNTLSFENREKAFTVSCDNFILEMGQGCPPECE